jgi:hypothetical protein
VDDVARRKEELTIAASAARVGAPVEGCPTSKCSTLWPSASFFEAACMTSCDRLRVFRATHIMVWLRLGSYKSVWLTGESAKTIIWLTMTRNGATSTALFPTFHRDPPTFTSPALVASTRLAAGIGALPAAAAPTATPSNLFCCRATQPKRAPAHRADSITPNSSTTTGCEEPLCPSGWYSVDTATLSSDMFVKQLPDTRAG